MNNSAQVSPETVGRLGTRESGCRMCCHCDLATPLRSEKVEWTHS